jgi:acetylornithine deacetylase/succinyl-diaminopimelate desuccinylase-like protein
MSVTDINWDDIGEEAARMLTRYIRVDTTNPPGNEAVAADFLGEQLSAESIPSTLYSAAPGRANLVATLKGDGSSPPVTLLHHMDVVPADDVAWTHDPFGGVFADGYVWGRGAIDDKGLGVMHLMALALLKRQGIPLGRDIVLLAVSDEEMGGGLGAAWMIDNQWGHVRSEYIWDEGGVGTRGILGSRPLVAISVSEKRSMTVELTARGTGGHGSMAAGAPVNRLVAALDRLQRGPVRRQIGPVTRTFLRSVAETQRFPASLILRYASNPLVRWLALNRLSAIPTIDAMLRDTINITMMQAGGTPNVVPSEARAVLDVRLLPWVDHKKFIDRLGGLLDDDTIEVEATTPPPDSPPSPTDSAFYTALSSAVQRHIPDAVVAPLQTPVATDSRFFRQRGVKAYGFMPAVFTQAELDTIHGRNERISVENLTLGTRIVYETLLELCARRTTGDSPTG